MSKATDSQCSGVIVEIEESKEETQDEPTKFVNSLKLYYFPSCVENEKVNEKEIIRVYEKHVLIIEKQ